MVGLSFAIKVGEGYYIPVPEDRTTAQSIVDEFRVILENENIVKIGQNIKYDMLVLKWYDVQVKGKLFDTMLAHYLIDPDTRHNMDVLSENYLGYTPISITTLIGAKGKNPVSYTHLDVYKRQALMLSVKSSSLVSFCSNIVLTAVVLSKLTSCIGPVPGFSIK